MVKKQKTEKKKAGGVAFKVIAVALGIIGVSSSMDVSSEMTPVLFSFIALCVIIWQLSGRKE